MRRLLPLLLPPLARVVVATLLATDLAAQGAPLTPFARLGGEVDRARRVESLLDTTSSLDRLLRASGTQTRVQLANRDTVLLFQPELFTVSHSAHPWRGNDGSLRAGVGQNVLLTTGLAYRGSRVSVTLLPQFLYERNGDFQTIPYPRTLVPQRSVWANPFYTPDNSLDYPQRFGDVSRSQVELQGRMSFRASRAVQFGVGREERWWGPSVENALVLSNNAPPLEQLFIESPEPIATRLGRLSYVYVLARVQESAFFDDDPFNNQRSLSAAAISFEPAVLKGLVPTIGMTRAVLANRSPSFATVLDVFRDVGRPWARPAEASRGRDQITGLFARWSAPQAGAAAWIEWVRYEQVASFRELLEEPGHSQGYTLGAEQAKPLGPGLLHVAIEFTYSEPSPSIRVRPVKTSYTGQGTVQGWTHDGQMLGPWIGPAASSQWLRADYRRPDWRTGVTFGRVRRDANVRFLNPADYWREDVQLYAGARYARTWRGLDAQVEFTQGVRLNHLYQAYQVPGTTSDESTGVDLLNRSLSITISPRLPGSRR